jgi:hypothetical protein
MSIVLVHVVAFIDHTILLVGGQIDFRPGLFPYSILSVAQLVHYSGGHARHELASMGSNRRGTAERIAKAITQKF